MSFSYIYPRVGLTVDVLCFFGEELLLIRRGAEPFEGAWALPGGYVEVSDEAGQGETLRAAAARELHEETGLKVAEAELIEVGTFAAPGRDPRQRNVTVAFAVELSGEGGPERAEPTAGDDAAEARWFRLNSLPPLAFDHDEIVVRSLVSRGAPTN